MPLNFKSYASASSFYLPLANIVASLSASQTSCSAVAMLAQIQADFQREEASLQKLTDSIAAYNPSVSAAEELVAADEAVHRDVEKRTIDHVGQT